MSVRLFISRDINVITNMIIAHDFEKNRMHPILAYTIATYQRNVYTSKIN